MSLLTLKQILYIDKVVNKNTTLVKTLDIQEGDEIQVSLMGMNTAYARYLTLYNPRNGKTKDKVSLNKFPILTGGFKYTQKY